MRVGPCQRKLLRSNTLFYIFIHGKIDKLSVPEYKHGALGGVITRNEETKVNNDTYDFSTVLAITPVTRAEFPLFEICSNKKAVLSQGNRSMLLFALLQSIT